MRAERRDPTLQRRVVANQQWEEPVPEAKPYDIPKQLVWDAYLEPDEALPGKIRFLAASLQRLEPAPSHLVAEPPQARVIARDCVIVQMPLQHLLHPRSGCRNGVVHTLAQLHLDCLELGSHSLLDGLAPDDK